MSILRQMREHKKAQRELRKKKAGIIRKLRNAIFSLPENDNIQILSKKPLCFTMMWSNLSSRDWTPEYYCFEKQYRAICREIRHKKFDEILPFLRKVIREGCIRKVEFSYFVSDIKIKTKVNLHPQVTENIKNMLVAR